MKTLDIRARPILERWSRYDLNPNCSISISGGSTIAGRAEDSTSGLTNDFSLKILVLHCTQNLGQEQKIINLLFLMFQVYATNF